MKRSLSVLLLALVSGCAAQHEEASRAESPPAADREYEDAPADEPEPTATAELPPPTLEQLQLELAANNAKLRDLGVVIPVELPVEEQEPKEPDTKAGGGELGGDGRGAGTATTAPAGQPQPSVKPSKSDRDRQDKKPRPDKTGGKTGAKAKEESLDLSDDRVQPDAAKAAPPSVTGQLDEAAVCQQVCDLAAISCGLGDQICELADRHPGEQHYASACERANVDCEAAKEACDACVE